MSLPVSICLEALQPVDDGNGGVDQEVVKRNEIQMDICLGFPAEEIAKRASMPSSPVATTDEAIQSALQQIYEDSFSEGSVTREDRKEMMIRFRKVMEGYQGKDSVEKIYKSYVEKGLWIGPITLGVIGLIVGGIIGGIVGIEGGPGVAATVGAVWAAMGGTLGCFVGLPLGFVGGGLWGGYVLWGEDGQRNAELQQYLDDALITL